ncbi:MAG: EamA family transporter [bacterium]
MADDAARRRTGIVLALGALYVIWGTTYFGIREAVASIPPLLMASLRFLAPGAILYAWTRRKAGRPTQAQWRRAFLVGGLMLAVGNGTVSLVETRMPSGIAALLVAMVPLWTAVWEWGLEHRPPNAFVVAGLALGLAGVGVLSRQGEGWTGGVEPLFFGIIMVGSLCWALGSILARRPGRPTSAWQDLAMQMLAGGALLALGSAALGEPVGFHPSLVPLSAWLWVLYLSVFGSVVALGCYLWLLRSTSPAVATTYAFVNPAVAVAVGSIAGHEPVTAITLAASVLIVGAVVLIVWSKARRQPAASPSPEA